MGNPPSQSWDVRGFQERMAEEAKHQPPFEGQNCTQSWPSGTESEMLRRLDIIERALARLERSIRRVEMRF